MIIRTRSFNVKVVAIEAQTECCSATLPQRLDSGKSETSPRSGQVAGSRAEPSGLRLRRAPYAGESIDDILRQTACSGDVDRVAAFSVGDAGISAGAYQEVQRFQAL